MPSGIPVAEQTFHEQRSGMPLKMNLEDADRRTPAGSIAAQDTDREPMPGRTFIGLDPSERNRAEFETAGLADGAFVSLPRVVIGIVVGLIVAGVGYDLHHPGGLLSDCQKAHPNNCALPPGGSVAMSLWLGLALLATAFIIAWPYLKYASKMARGHIPEDSR